MTMTRIGTARVGGSAAAAAAVPAILTLLVGATSTLASTVASPSSTTTTTMLRHPPPPAVLPSSQSDANGGGTVSHRLVPHRAQSARRGLTEDESREERRLARSSRPTTYPRSKLAQESGGGGYDDAEQQRSLQQQIGALYQGYGTHYVDLWVGTDVPQRQTVIVDTGSGVTAFPCSGCKDCGSSYHTDGYFVEADSKSFTALECNACYRGHCATMDGAQRCRISMSYQEGSSWSAYEAIDKAYCGGPHVDGPTAQAGEASNVDVQGWDPHEAAKFAFDLTFGCQTSITGLFKTQLADGIMGMDNNGAAFWKQMKTADVIPASKFGLCFSRQPTADREGTEAGAMTLGGVDKRLHHSPMVFAKNTRGSGFYAVHLKKVYLRAGGGESAKADDPATQTLHQLNVDENTLNSGGVIVDSGTTDTYFTRKIATQFKSMFKQLTGRDYTHNAIKLTPEELRSMPTILFQMTAHPGGIGDEIQNQPGYDKKVGSPGLAGPHIDASMPSDVILAIPASHYMEYDSDDGTYTARFYVEEGSGSVLGANAMMGHDVLFDVDNNRIGWAESDCDYMKLVEAEKAAAASGGTTTSSESEKAETTGGGSSGDGTGGSSSDDDGETSSSSGISDMFSSLSDSCDTDSCKSFVGLTVGILGAIIVVFAVRYVRRRRTQVRYQNAEVEIADLSDLSFAAEHADDEEEERAASGGYTDEPPVPPPIS